MGANDTAMADVYAPGSPDIDITKIFESFGYTPSKAEAQALQGAFSSLNNAASKGAGVQAIANYVIAHQAINGAQSAIQGQLKGSQEEQAQYQALGKQYGDQGVQNLQAAADVFKSAPQLFGGLTQDQVGQYLKPLQNQFDYGLGQVTGQAASRGLGGSSLESNSMAQAQTQYQQQVLQQALQLGIQQQQQRSQGLAALGQGQLGLSGQFTGAGTNYGSLINQLLGQNMGAAETQAQLAPQMAANGVLMGSVNSALDPGKQNFFGRLGTNFQNLGLNAITNAGGNLLNTFSNGLTQPPGSSGSNPMSGGAMGASIQSLLGKLFGGGGGGGTSGLADTGTAGSFGAGSSLLPAALSL